MGLLYAILPCAILNHLLGQVDSARLLGQLKIPLRRIGRAPLPVIYPRAQQRVELDRMFPVHEVTALVKTIICTLVFFAAMKYLSLYIRMDRFTPADLGI